MLRERPAHRATDAGTGLLREDVVRARYQFSELEHQSRARMVMPSFGAEQLPVPRAHVHLGGDIADRGGPFELWDADVNPNRAERHQHVDRGLAGSPASNPTIASRRMAVSRTVRVIGPM